MVLHSTRWQFSQALFKEHKVSLNLSETEILPLNSVYSDAVRHFTFKLCMWNVLVCQKH